MNDAFWVVNAIYILLYLIFCLVMSSLLGHKNERIDELEEQNMKLNSALDACIEEIEHLERFAKFESRLARALGMTRQEYTEASMNQYTKESK